jgi:hypothetical protein
VCYNRLMESHSGNNDFVDPLKDVAVGLAEVGLDMLMDEGVYRDIPLLGSIVGLVKAAHSIPDLLLHQKVASFLLTLPTIRPEEKARFNAEMADDPKKRKKVGEILLLLLDRYSDFDKVKILAILFAAYIRNEITVEEFRRLGQAVDQAFVDDLKDLLREDEDWRYLWGEVMLSNLLRTGLTAFSKDVRERRMVHGPGYPDTTNRPTRGYNIKGPFANPDIVLTGLGALYLSIMLKAKVSVLADQ